MKSQLAVAIALVVVALIAVGDAGLDPRPKQSAGAKGWLKCDGRPASNVLVKLYDKDKFVSLDDKMAQTKTDAQGYFQLQGSANEATTIDPKIYIYHDCNDGVMPCQRRIGIAIPKSYVSQGSIARRHYDAGTIELAGKFSGEARDCIH